MTLVYRRDGKLPTAAQGQTRHFDHAPTASDLPRQADILSVRHLAEHTILPCRHPPPR
jgi:hypothetical protein